MQFHTTQSRKACSLWQRQAKKNIFSGRILEIEGLPDITIEQAFELTDACAERSAAGATIKLDSPPIIEYMESNIVMLKWMVAEGYGDVRTLMRRADKMREWIDTEKALNEKGESQLLKRDDNAKYDAILEVPLKDVTEPILCAPNDPDDARKLSEVCNGWEVAHLDGVQSGKIDEVFIGSCMTNIGHFRAAGKLLKAYGGQVPTRLWVAPPTKMDESELTKEGYYSIYGTAGARTEMPGCSLCMGNQARVADKATVVSTSTRNFPNRLGKGANVFLASAELAAVTAILGRLPTPAEYLEYEQQLDKDRADTYRYLNFHLLDNYVEKSKDSHNVLAKMKA